MLKPLTWITKRNKWLKPQDLLATETQKEEQRVNQFQFSNLMKMILSLNPMMPSPKQTELDAALEVETVEEIVADPTYSDAEEGTVEANVFEAA